MRILTIDSNRYVLPTDMAAKDIQALAGFLCSLTTVGNEYNYDASEYVYYENGGVSIRVSECEVLTKAAAVELGDQSRARYQAKRDAEERAKAGDLIGLHVNQ